MSELIGSATLRIIFGYTEAECYETLEAMLSLAEEGIESPDHDDFIKAIEQRLEDLQRNKAVGLINDGLIANLHRIKTSSKMQTVVNDYLALPDRNDYITEAILNKIILERIEEEAQASIPSSSFLSSEVSVCEDVF